MSLLSNAFSLPTVLRFRKMALIPTSSSVLSTSLLGCINTSNSSSSRGFTAPLDLVDRRLCLAIVSSADSVLGDLDTEPQNTAASETALSLRVPPLSSLCSHSWLSSPLDRRYGFFDTRCTGLGRMRLDFGLDFTDRMLDHGYRAVGPEQAVFSVHMSVAYCFRLRHTCGPSQGRTKADARGATSTFYATRSLRYALYVASHCHRQSARGPIASRNVITLG